MGGNNYDRIKEIASKIEPFGFTKYDKNNKVCYGKLKEKITQMLQLHNATQEDIENLYQQIIVEMLN